MAEPYAGMRYDEMPDLWDGFARLVRPALGISAFGANVMNLPPDYETKAHDETESGQEELYVALAGSGAVLLGENRQRPRGHARADHRRHPGAGLRGPGLVERRRRRGLSRRLSRARRRSACRRARRSPGPGWSGACAWAGGPRPRACACGHRR